LVGIGINEKQDLEDDGEVVLQKTVTNAAKQNLIRLVDLPSNAGDKL